MGSNRFSINKSQTANAFNKMQEIIEALEEAVYQTACREFPLGSRVKWFTRAKADGSPCFSRGEVILCSKNGFKIRMTNLNRVIKNPKDLIRDVDWQ